MSEKELIETLKRELGKTFKLKLKEAAAGMFYEGKACSCCQIPTLKIVGEYETVRYGKRDEYYIHVPYSAKRLGKVEFEGKVYTIFLSNGRLFALYHKHNEGVGWLTCVFEITCNE